MHKGIKFYSTELVSWVKIEPKIGPVKTENWYFFFLVFWLFQFLKLWGFQQIYVNSLVCFKIFQIKIYFQLFRFAPNTRVLQVLCKYNLGPIPRLSNKSSPNTSWRSSRLSVKGKAQTSLWRYFSWS